MAKEPTKEQAEKQHLAFKAKKDYYKTLNNYLAVERNRLASDAILIIMNREVEVAKRKMDIAQANCEY